jgi:hypothetical protein
MLEIGPVKGTIARQPEARCRHIRDRMLVTWILCGVVRATQALAGEQAPNTDAPLGGAKNSREAPTGTSMFAAPFVSAKPPADEAFSKTEFRPRKRSIDILNSGRREASIIDAPMPQNTSVWQQMAEFKSQNRVRLLTLWQTQGSSLSLQAGKRGAPSLQWSTPWARHEGAVSHGLFDHLLTVPRMGGGIPHANLSRPTITQTPVRPLD